MIGFFLISDTEQTPKYPDRLLFAGGVEMLIFARLQRLALWEGVDYHSDFRWSAETVAKIGAALKQAAENTDTRALLAILQAAVAKQCGLLAVVD